MENRQNHCSAKIKVFIGVLGLGGSGLRSGMMTRSGGLGSLTNPNSLSSSFQTSLSLKSSMPLTSTLKRPLLGTTVEPAKQTKLDTATKPNYENPLLKSGSLKSNVSLQSSLLKPRSASSKSAPLMSALPVAGSLLSSSLMSCVDTSTRLTSSSLLASSSSLVGRQLVTDSSRPNLTGLTPPLAAIKQRTLVVAKPQLSAKPTRAKNVKAGHRAKAKQPKVAKLGSDGSSRKRKQDLGEEEEMAERRSTYKHYVMPEYNLECEVLEGDPALLMAHFPEADRDKASLSRPITDIEGIKVHHSHHPKQLLTNMI